MNSKIKGLLNEEMPREKLIKFGVENLTNVELLAILLRTGTFEKNVLELSREILEKFGSKSLSRQTFEELIKIKGVSKAKACQIVSVFELSRRLAINKEESKIKLNSSAQVFEHVYFLFKSLSYERIFLILVDSKNQIIREEFIFEGGVNFSYVDIRKIIKKVLSFDASGFFLIHNHPSGDVTPSKEDLNLSLKLKKLCEELQVRFLDHLIVCEKYYSMFDNSDI